MNSVLGQGHVASLLTSDLRRSLFNASGCCDHPNLIIRMGFQWLPLYINLNNGPSSQKEGNPQSLPICSERLLLWLDAFYYPMHATISKQCHGVWGTFKDWYRLLFSVPIEFLMAMDARAWHGLKMLAEIYCPGNQWETIGHSRMCPNWVSDWISFLYLPRQHLHGRLRHSHKSNPRLGWRIRETGDLPQRSWKMERGHSKKTIWNSI